MEINDDLYKQLRYLGIIDAASREYNEGNSDYSERLIQPWTIWLAYPELTSWDHDIIKRLLRTKLEPGMSEREARILDYKKCIHILNERIRQLENNDY